MEIKKIALSSNDEAVLKNDLLDIDGWVVSAVNGKINNCRKRMIQQWLPKLYADPSVTQIPASEGAVVAMIVSRADYSNRVERDQGYPEGDPSASWLKAQLRNYCQRNSVDYEESDNKAQLVVKIEAAE